MGLVEWSLARCFLGKVMSARTSGSASSMMVANLGPFGLIWSATAAIGCWLFFAVSRAKPVAMKAETTRRPLLPARSVKTGAGRLRRKGTRQRCLVASSSLDPAALMPSCASKITSLTPRNPRRLGLASAHFHSQNLTASIRVDAHRDDGRDRDNPAPAPELEGGCVDPETGPIAVDGPVFDGPVFDGPVKEGLHLAVDVFAQAADLAFGETRHAHGLDRILERPGGTALNISLLEDRRQCLGQPTPWPARRLGSGKPGKQRPVRSLGRRNSTLPARPPRENSPPDCFLTHIDPIPVAGTVALGLSAQLLLAVSGTGRGAHFQFHPPLGSQTNPLAQKRAIGRLLTKRPQVHHLFAHRCSLRFWGGASTQTPTGNRR